MKEWLKGGWRRVYSEFLEMRNFVNNMRTIGDDEDDGGEF